MKDHTAFLGSMLDNVANADELLKRVNSLIAFGEKNNIKGSATDIIVECRDKISEQAELIRKMAEGLVQLSDYLDEVQDQVDSIHEMRNQQ